jgi:hypothetical protein
MILYSTKHQKRVRLFLEGTKRMLLRRDTTIIWDPVAIGVPFQSGKEWK